MIVYHGVPAWVVLAGQFADFFPGIEDRLWSVIPLGGQIPCVEFVPEPYVALSTGEEAVFRESGGLVTEGE